MNERAIPANRYTDSPQTWSNLLFGSLQILGWLLFHPTAWRNHLARLDPSLPPNFSLVKLRPSQWRNPQIRWLLFSAYLILPLLAGFLAALILLAMDHQPQSVILAVLVGLTISMVGSLMGSAVVGVPVSIVAAPLVSFTSTMAAAMGLGIGLTERTNIPFDGLTLGLISGLVFGMGGSLVGSVGSNVANEAVTSDSNRRQGGIVIGILLGSILSFVGGQTLSGLTNQISLLEWLVCLIAGMAVGWRQRPWAGLVIGTVTLIAMYLAVWLENETILSVVFFGTMLLPIYVVVERWAGPWPGAIVSTVGGAGGWIAATIMASGLEFWSVWPLSMVSLGFGLIMPLWWPLLIYPFQLVWHSLIYWLDERRVEAETRWLFCHAAFWDEGQYLPFPGLDDHVLLALTRYPEEGQAALEYLATSRQRWAAQAVQIELEAHSLAACANAEQIGRIHHRLGTGELEGPASALLRSLSRISQDVEVAIGQESAFNQRLALKAVEDRLDSLIRELTRSSDRYAARFQPIVTDWRRVVADEVEERIATVELRQEIDNPYIIGVPLTEQQELFVGRADICARIEKLLLDQRRPPLLLYGQRRMGKTSLLNNLGRLLPSTIVPLFVDLQGPVSLASNYAGFLQNLARGMINSARRQCDLTLPPLSRATLEADPFTAFDLWLDEVEEILGTNQALLALDEFEALDEAFGKGRFEAEAVLTTLRHIIQHRPRFKVLLAGSHTLAEFQRWAGYLINAEVIHIDYLREEETRQLIEKPVKDFVLVYEPAAAQRVVELTHCHPFLVQLLCSEIIAYKNEQPPQQRRLATKADVEAVVPEVLKRGSFFFADIARNQVDPAGQDCLKFLARQGAGAVVNEAVLEDRVRSVVEPAQVLTQLCRRELIEPIGDGYRFQVELIRCWFAQSS